MLEQKQLNSPTEIHKDTVIIHKKKKSTLFKIFKLIIE
jgi:hypothetical protein